MSYIRKDQPCMAPNSLQALQYMIKVREAQELYYSTRPQWQGITPFFSDMVDKIPQPTISPDLKQSEIWSGKGTPQGSKFGFRQDTTEDVYTLNQWFWEFNQQINRWEGASQGVSLFFKRSSGGVVSDTVNRSSTSAISAFFHLCSCASASLIFTQMNSSTSSSGATSTSNRNGIMYPHRVSNPFDFSFGQFPYGYYPDTSSNDDTFNYGCPITCDVVIAEQYRKKPPSAPTPPPLWREIVINGCSYPAHFARTDDNDSAVRTLAKVGSLVRTVEPDLGQRAATNDAVFGEFLPLHITPYP